MSKNIGYHTRLCSDNSVKVVGGSFGGRIDDDTVNRLVNAHLTVIIKPSGRGVFVDRESREVSLYLSIDPLETEAGRKALDADKVRRQALQLVEDEKVSEIEDLMSSMSPEEILERLRK